MDASLSLAESASLEEEHARMRDNIEALYKTLGKSSGAATAVAGAPETPQAAAYSYSGVVSPLPAEPLPAASAPLPPLATDYSVTPIESIAAATWSPPPQLPMPTGGNNISAQSASVIELTGELH